TAVTALRLHQNVPNPFNPHTKISFTIGDAASVELAVYDSRGRRVRILLEEQLLAEGPHRADWNGRDDAGRALPSGIYLARLVTGDRVAGITMVLLK
ncbi:MAG: T9SS type A sorting domain-containing protein, partial [Candidatus Krumholzibacteria bacterium]|nr:T9SS type A sorting domain-containing protein [Candidatus Krumholzibacteria bacterium]